MATIAVGAGPHRRARPVDRPVCIGTLTCDVIVQEPPIFNATAKPPAAGHAAAGWWDSIDTVVWQWWACSARCCRPMANASCGRKGAPRSARGAVQTDGLKPERRYARHAVCGPRIADSDGRFGGAVVTPIWGSCGMALSATADAHAGRSGASSRGCLHRAPAQLAGNRGRREWWPGSKVLPVAHAAALNHAQCYLDATCASAKAQEYVAMVYARASSASLWRLAGASRGGVY